MATELGRFLSEQLTGLPQDHSDRAFIKSIERITERYINRPKESPLSCLTPREIEVLGLISQGFSNRTIAGNLVLGEKSVWNYIRSIFHKIGLSGEDTEVNARVKSVLLYQENTPDFNNPVEEYCYISPLSPRQKEILSLIGEGYSNSKIACQLNIPLKSVESCINIVLGKKIVVEKQTYSPRVVLALVSQTRYVIQ